MIYEPINSIGGDADVAIAALGGLKMTRYYSDKSVITSEGKVYTSSDLREIANGIILVADFLDLGGNHG